MEAKKIYFKEEIAGSTRSSSPRGPSRSYEGDPVVLDYLPDVFPFSDAWVRVHSMDLTDGELPVLQNVKKEERTEKDLRWKSVRNTSFMKSIGTIGSLLADLVALKLLGHVKIFSGEKRK